MPLLHVVSNFQGMCSEDKWVIEGSAFAEYGGRYFGVLGVWVRL